MNPFGAPVVAIIGRSGAGKTWFLERLIPVLEADGWRLALLKHTHQMGLETDRPGSDSYRFWTAGARHVVLATPDRVVHTHRYETEPALSMVLNGIHDVDMVLVEGYKSSSIPKVEIVRAALDRRPLDNIHHRLAFVTDVPDLRDEARWFALEDIQGVARFLVHRFLR